MFSQGNVGEFDERINHMKIYQDHFFRVLPLVEPLLSPFRSPQCHCRVRCLCIHLWSTSGCPGSQESWNFPDIQRSFPPCCMWHRLFNKRIQRYQHTFWCCFHRCEGRHSSDPMSWTLHSRQRRLRVEKREWGWWFSCLEINDYKLTKYFKNKGSLYDW